MPEVVISSNDPEVTPVKTTLPKIFNKLTRFFIRIKPGILAFGWGDKKKPGLVLPDPKIEKLPFVAFGGDDPSKPVKFIFEKDSLKGNNVIFNDSVKYTSDMK